MKFDRIKAKCVKRFRFLELSLHNYGIFYGSCKFVFDQQRTIIVGGSGTGKTTIAKALANLGPVPGIMPNIHADPESMSVNASTVGDHKLVRTWAGIIFLGYDSGAGAIIGNQDVILAKEIDDQDRKAIAEEAQQTFAAMLKGKPWKIEAHRDLNSNLMAAGEKTCLHYAYAFAVRKVLNLDLPVVLDSPYDRLDEQLRANVRAFLRGQECQQIILVSEMEVIEEDDASYFLPCPEYYIGQNERVQ